VVIRNSSRPASERRRSPARRRRRRSSKSSSPVLTSTSLTQGCDGAGPTDALGGPKPHRNTLSKALMLSWTSGTVCREPQGTGPPPTAPIPSQAAAAASALEAGKKLLTERLIEVLRDDEAAAVDPEGAVLTYGQRHERSSRLTPPPSHEDLLSERTGWLEPCQSVMGSWARIPSKRRNPRSRE
jgi:hypothetical protein